MSTSHKVFTISDAEQTEQDMSFKGGVPNIPDRFEVPCCSYCGAPLTFFFQVAFPKGHVWEGKVVAFFDCTSWEHPNNPNLDWQLDIIYTRDQIHIPDGLLDSYQKNFRILVFDAQEPTSLQPQFAEKLEFERLEFESANPRARYADATKLGGIPAWNHRVQGDHKMYKEITYMGGGVDFLMQIPEDWKFKRLPQAPLQYEYYQQYKEDVPRRQIYSPFKGASIKFFGTNSSYLEPQRVLMYLGL